MTYYYIQAYERILIKLQKTTNGDSSTDRSGPELIKFSAQTTCQSALATHKHACTDLASRITLQIGSQIQQQNNNASNGRANSNTVLIKNVGQLK